MYLGNGSRRHFLSVAFGAVFGGWSATAQVRHLSETPGDDANLAAFEEVWETVRDRFFDPRLHGLDWQAVRSHYRSQAATASSREETAAAINAMLAELRASHTHYYTPDDPAYYQLADIFSFALRRRGLEGVFPSGQVTYPGIGAFTHLDERGHIFIAGVVEGAPAHHSGLIVGDEILSVDDRPFRPVGSFRNIGVPASLLIRRTPNGSPTIVDVTSTEIHPNAMFLRGLKASVRVISGDDNARIGYVHVWSYAGQAYQTALEDMIAEEPLRNADALIWDLRDGWGGAQPEYLDIFNPRAPTMQVTDRDGKTGMVDVKWRKPVAMLINGGTRSGKEVLAYGFKEYKLGELVGVRTEGAVLGATAFLIGNEGLLLLAVEDVLVDGQRLEGVGVAPTVEVPFDLRYAAGADPQLERAVKILSRS
jgi:carboxyl-terminal processing protease